MATDSGRRLINVKWMAVEAQPTAVGGPPMEAGWEAKAVGGPPTAVGRCVTAVGRSRRAPGQSAAAARPQGLPFRDAASAPPGARPTTKKNNPPNHRRSAGVTTPRAPAGVGVTTCESESDRLVGAHVRHLRRRGRLPLVPGDVGPVPPALPLVARARDAPRDRHQHPDQAHPVHADPDHQLRDREAGGAARGIVRRGVGRVRCVGRVR